MAGTNKPGELIRPGVHAARIRRQTDKAAGHAKPLSVEIAQLRDLDLEGLRLRWRNLFQRAAPSHAPKFLLVRIIAYRLQAEVYGDLSKDARRTLERLVDQETQKVSNDAAALGADPTRDNARALQVGAILIREWNSAVHRVVVTENGFAWNGEVYPSLSKIARLITGGKWNGPRFFGLRARNIGGLSKSPSVLAAPPLQTNDATIVKGGRP